MSLLAGAGGFTQSAVLFPTAREKNKQTEACSRHPQASSLLHGKGRHRWPFFTRGVGGSKANPLVGGGWPGRGLGGRNRSAALHLPCKSTEQSAPDEGLVCPGLGRPGQRSGGGTPPCLDPRMNPKLASEAWEAEGWFPSFLAVLLAGLCTVGAGRTWLGEGTDTTASEFSSLPPRNVPVHCWLGTYSHPQVKSRTIPLWGWWVLPQSWAPPDLGYKVYLSVGSHAPPNPQETLGPGGGEGGRGGRGQAILSCSFVPKLSSGSIAPPFTWGRQSH